MTDAQNTATLSDVLWPDAELESVTIDYDAVVLLLTESTGIKRRIFCHGHLGMELPGFWDEVVVAQGEVLDQDPFLDRCQTAIQERFRNSPPATGNDDRNSKVSRLLRVTLGDGTELKVVASRFESEDVPR